VAYTQKQEIDNQYKEFYRDTFSDPLLVDNGLRSLEETIEFEQYPVLLGLDKKEVDEFAIWTTPG
jgi:hypothetical protein